MARMSCSFPSRLRRAEGLRVLVLRAVGGASGWRSDRLVESDGGSARHLCPWMAWLAEEPKRIDERREMLARWERNWSEEGDVLLSVFLDGRVAGSCVLHRRRNPQTLEIGYWIHVSFLRQGLATRVAAMLTDAAFSVAGITRAEIHHDKANVASSGVPRRLGYAFVGEEPDEAGAPAEIGVDCVWRIERESWDGSRREGHA